jgi:hypothetical protein
MPTLASYASRDSSRLGPLAVSISMLAGSIISVAWLVYSSQRAEGQKVLIAQGVSYDVGTLLPGAVASAIVLAFGALAVGRSRK